MAIMGSNKGVKMESFLEAFLTNFTFAAIGEALATILTYLVAVILIFPPIWIIGIVLFLIFLVISS